MEHFVALIEQLRRLLERVHTVAGTEYSLGQKAPGEYLRLLEPIVALLYEKVQP